MKKPLPRREALKLGLLATAGLPLGRVAHGPRHSPPSDPEFESGLAELVRKHRMPGALAGVYRDGAVITAGAGIANLNTRQPMTPELGFLTGSITKVWSCTLVMTFVDEGKIDLDRPLIEYLPHLRFGDPDVTRRLTTKHLLNHSSGIDSGDFIRDFGEGPASHRLIVEAMGQLGQLHPLGKYSSYNNGGWILAGHLMEVISGKPWHRLLEERVIKPLGAARTFTDAEDGVLYGAVVGSVPDAARKGEHMATPKFLLPKTYAPAGATLLPNLADNLLFAQMHIRGGLAPNGKRVISEAAAKRMATRTIDHPSGPATGFGLGWFHSTPGGQVTLSHGGGSNGGRAMLVAVPGSDFAFATFVNSNAGDQFQPELEEWIRSRYQPNRPAESPPVAPSGPIDPKRFLGVYRRTTTRTTVREAAEGFAVESAWVPEDAPGTEAYMIGRPVQFPMRASAPNALVSATAAPGSRPVPYTFLDPDERGRYRLLYASGRLSKRIAD